MALRVRVVKHFQRLGFCCPLPRVRFATLGCGVERIRRTTGCESGFVLDVLCDIVSPFGMPNPLELG